VGGNCGMNSYVNITLYQMVLGDTAREGEVDGGFSSHEMKCLYKILKG
jgi:hypothetical protein